MSAWSLPEKPEQQTETTDAAFKMRQLSMMYIMFLKRRQESYL